MEMRVGESKGECGREGGRAGGGTDVVATSAAS